LAKKAKNEWELHPGDYSPSDQHVITHFLFNNGHDVGESRRQRLGTEEAKKILALKKSEETIFKKSAETSTIPPLQTNRTLSWTWLNVTTLAKRLDFSIKNISRTLFFNQWVCFALGTDLDLTATITVFGPDEKNLPNEYEEFQKSFSGSNDIVGKLSVGNINKVPDRVLAKKVNDFNRQSEEYFENAAASLLKLEEAQSACIHRFRAHISPTKGANNNAGRGVPDYFDLVILYTGFNEVGQRGGSAESNSINANLVASLLYRDGAIMTQSTLNQGDYLRPYRADGRTLTAYQNAHYCMLPLRWNYEEEMRMETR